MNNQFSGSRLQKNLETNTSLQYINQYDSNGYAQPQMASRPLFNAPPLSREAYHINENGLNPIYASNAIQQIGNSRVKSEASRFVSSQVKNEEIVKGESRVNYVPYEKKIIEYENRTYIEKVPVKRKVVNYEQHKIMETIPREVIKQDYYAVEKRVQYFKEIIPEKRIEMTQVERKVKRYEYVPVQRQIVHYPENIDLETAKGQSRIVLKNQGVQVQPDAQFRPINPTLIYNYSNRPESRNNPIGYYDQGQSRVFSNAPTFMSPNFAQQTSYLRTQSAQKIDQSRAYSPYRQEGQSYIKQLNTINKGQLKRPFEMLQNRQ